MSSVGGEHRPQKRLERLLTRPATVMSLGVASVLIALGTTTLRIADEALLEEIIDAGDPRVLGVGFGFGAAFASFLVRSRGDAAVAPSVRIGGALGLAGWAISMVLIVLGVITFLAS